MKKLFSSFLFALLCLGFSPSAHANFFKIGIKYGIAYIDDYEDGKTYSALLSFPLDRTFDLEVEYGKFEDDDDIVDGEYLGAYLGVLLINVVDFPFRAKLGIVKEEVDFDDPGNLELSEIDEEDFSFGLGTGIRTPYFSGYLEYLQISDEVYTLALRFNF